MATRPPLEANRYSAGFTLIELMMTLAIAAVLLGLAAPSFRNMIVDYRIRNASLDLISQLTLARSEAIKRNGNVSVASATGSGLWQLGWRITANGNVVSEQQPYPQVEIRAYDPNLGGPFQAAAQVRSVVYNRNGRLNGSAASFQIRDPFAGSSTRMRCVTVTVTGMPVSKAGSCQ